MTTAEASRRGRRNRRAGHDTERMLAGFLRQWWPDAARRWETGQRTGERESPDHGDIRGTPLTWQAKYHRNRVMTDGEVDEALTEVENQAVAAGTDVGIVVERRSGKADPAYWWAWVTGSDLSFLLAEDFKPFSSEPAVVERVPVRMRLGDLVRLLIRNGYGETT